MLQRECLMEQNTKSFEKPAWVFLVSEGLEMITIISPWRKDRTKDNSCPKFLTCINYIFVELYIYGEDETWQLIANWLLFLADAPSNPFAEFSLICPGCLDEISTSPCSFSVLGTSSSMWYVRCNSMSRLLYLLLWHTAKLCEHVGV